MNDWAGALTRDGSQQPASRVSVGIPRDNFIPQFKPLIPQEVGFASCLSRKGAGTSRFTLFLGQVTCLYEGRELDNSQLAVTGVRQNAAECPRRVRDKSV